MRQLEADLEREEIFVVFHGCRGQGSMRRGRGEDISRMRCVIPIPRSGRGIGAAALTREHFASNPAGGDPSPSARDDTVLSQLPITNYQVPPFASCCPRSS